jgi:uncharacterized membrane protein
MAPPLLPLAFLLFASFSAVLIALVAYALSPRPDTRLPAVVTMLLIYAVLALAPLHFLSPSPLQHKSTSGPSWGAAPHP